LKKLTTNLCLLFGRGQRFILCSSFVFLFIQNDAFGFQKDTNTTDYWISLNDYFNLSLDFETDYEIFDLQGADFEYDIRPNFNYVNLIGIDYRALSIFFSYVPPIGGNNDQELKGKSSHTGFGFVFNSSRWLNRFHYSKVEGYYLENSEDFIPDFINGATPYIQFDDLKITSYQGSHSYNFNPNFSFGAVSSQMAIQLKSAGSFIPGLFYNYFKVANRSGNGQRSKNLELIINTPYYYTHVINKKWYAGIGLIPGIGMHFTHLTTTIGNDDFETNYDGTLFRLKATLGLGYNSKTFYAGVAARFLEPSKHKKRSMWNIRKQVNHLEYSLGSIFLLQGRSIQLMTNLKTNSNNNII